MADKNLYDSALPKYIFAASFVVSLYWIMGSYTNVYTYAFTGAVYEILWLPMILLLFALPAVTIIFWYKKKFNFQSLYLWSVLMIGLAVILLAAK